MRAGCYPTLLLSLIFIWPLYLLQVLVLPHVIMVLILNAAIIANAWYQCASSELGYFEGMVIISAPLLSGCANITIIYLLLILFIVFLISVYFSVVALFREREYAQDSWRVLVIRINNMRP